jgi:hypothetical protein
MALGVIVLQATRAATVNMGRVLSMRARVRIRIPIVLGLTVGIGWAAMSPTLGAQSPLDRLKQAAEAAKRAIDAKQAVEEAARKDREQTKKTEPAPASGQPNAAAPPGQGGAASASSAKVEAQVLLTSAPGQQLAYVISPKGQHVAGIALRGSREVLVYDGVDGPIFDEVLKIQGMPVVVFSDDGTRYSYVGRAGQDFVYLVDGKEVARFPVATTDLFGGAVGSQFPTNGTTAAIFTANSRHYYFVVRSKPAAAGNDVSTFYFDGKPGPPLATDPPLAPAFSPDGEHYAYVAFEPKRTGRWVLIVDGKQAAWQGGAPRFTGDSKHLVTSTQLTGGTTELQMDGKPWLRAAEARPHFAPGSDRIVTAVRPSPQQTAWFLDIGGKKVPGSDSTVAPVIWFSADGKHWAAACKTAAGTQFIIADGKKGLEYQAVDAIDFTADGRFVYKATMPGSKHFIVVGDMESDAYQQIIPSGVGLGGDRSAASGEDPFAAVVAGSRVAFTASRTYTADGSVVVIDGKATPTLNPTALTLSPDGSRYAYAFGRIPSASQVMVDGVTHGGMILEQRASREPKLTFSPDGKHIAYAASSADQRLRGLSINGKFIPYAEVPQFPAANRTFTPDGRHLLWLAGFQRGRSAIYVDGRRAVELDNDGLLLIHTASTDRFSTWWSMAEDGTLTMIAQDGASLKRFRITPGPDTSVDTLAKMSAIR